MEVSNDGGYIYLWKQIQNTSFYKKPLACHLAVHLIMKANYEDRKIIFNNQELIIKRGEHLTGRKKLSEETGLSEQETRTSLKILKNAGFLTIKPTNKFSIISILKYDHFQRLPTSKSTNKQPTSNQQVTTPNKENKYKEIKEIYIYYCNSFKKNPNQYKLSPKRKKAIDKRLEDCGFEMLKEAVRRAALHAWYNGSKSDWQADLDWILNSYERVEKMANLQVGENEEYQKELEKIQKSKLVGGYK